MFYWIVYYPNAWTNYILAIGLFTDRAFGFMTSLGMRYFYRHLLFKYRSFGTLALAAILTSIVGTTVWFWGDFALTGLYRGFERLMPLLKLRTYVGRNFSQFFTLVTWSAFYFVIKLWIEWNEQKKRTEEANALAQSAQLQMLRYQLNPHFLFNALNSIRALVEEDKKAAKMMITELAEFLRYSLVSKSFSDVPLSEELDAIRHYLTIQKRRFEEKLEVEYRIEPSAEDFPVLSFLIHPLVENAVKYGMKTSAMPLKICIEARVREKRLFLQVNNSGHWVEPLAENTCGTGTGLTNVRRRLENVFPGRHRLSVITEDKTVKMILEIEGDEKSAD
ncbi:histidine kinase [candidate division KSB1 bacterium]|nr:histidine kinase [candidate division KSB1 bacterium]